MMKRYSRTVGVALTLVAGAFSCALAQTPVDDFDTAWEAIRDTHFDPNLNGVDWEAVRDELRPAAAEADRDAGRGIIQEMLGRLGQSHFSLLPKGGGGITPYRQDGQTRAGILETPEPREPTLELVSAENQSDPGKARPGIEVRLIDDAVIVVEVRAGSEAERRGVHPGWEILAIGERALGPIIVKQVESLGRRSGSLYVWQGVTALLMGDEGTGVRLVVVNGDDKEIAITLEREAPVEPAVAFAQLPAMSPGFVSRWIETEGSGQDATRIGYISFDVWLQTIPRQFDAAMYEFKDADGIVIDIRGNVGGIGAIAMLVGRYLVDEPASLGTMRMRNQVMNFNMQPVLVSMEGEDLDPYAGPVAVLIDGGSASTSEIFAAGIRELGRARLFGEQTPGLALPAMLTELPSGDVLLHAMAGFETPNGVSMEAAGVTPDVLAPWDRQELLAGRDGALDAAIQWIVNGEE